MPTADEPLATVAQLEAFVGNKLNPVGAELALDLASSTVREHCGWHIAPSIDDEITVDGSGTYALELPTLWATDISEVTELGETIDDYSWSRRGQLRRQRRRWTGEFRGITVTLTHGRVTTPGVVLSAVLSAAQRSMMADPGTQSITVGSLSKTYATGPSASIGTTDLSRREIDALGRWTLPPQQGDG